jgi:hypothetical protein
MSNSAAGDAKIPEDDLKKPSTEVWQGEDLGFSFSSSS